MANPDQAAMGSWSARKLLDIPQEANVKPLDDAEIADRFFFGDVQTFTTLPKLVSRGHTNTACI
ncbi:UNVERIFIED_ORG: hypothetical protein M2193_008367 [Bradyrhizobium japonicum]|uniref:hypothetical protein n=1 Tax=Bradyrhizobium diazoefficiens TaxID=1355477 RepID=UPI0034894571